jgi:hypothetical protein
MVSSAKKETGREIIYIEKGLMKNPLGSDKIEKI